MVVDSKSFSGLNRRLSADLGALAVLWALLIVHLSLYPYGGWRDLGAGAWSYWHAPWIPPYQAVLWTDIIVNILGYVPLGLLAALSWQTIHPRSVIQHALIRRLILVTAIALLSATLEAMQTFLPTRVPSKLDWATNLAGGVIGVLIAWLAQAWLHGLATRQGRRLRWLDHRRNLAMATMVIWLFSLLAPQTLPFTLGPWLGDLWVLFGPQSPLLDTGLVPNSPGPSIENWAEIIAVTGSLVASWSLGLAHTRPRSPRLRIICTFIFFTILTAWLGPQAIRLRRGEWPGLPEPWELNTIWSILIAIAIVFILIKLRWPGRRYALIGMMSCLVSWLSTALLPGYVAVRIWPAPDPLETLITYLQAASGWVGMLWPMMLILLSLRILDQTHPTNPKPTTSLGSS